MSEIIIGKNVSWGFLKEDAPENPDDRTFEDLELLFENLDISIPSGITSLTGPNGVGKSSLLFLLSGRILPITGEIFVTGTNTTAWSTASRDEIIEASRNKTISLVFQNMELEFDDTLGSILESLPKSNNPFIDKILQALDLEEFYHLPSDKLSFGAMQRAIIAIAIQFDPKILVLDEALFAVEPAIQDKILKALFDYYSQGDRHLIFTAHDIDLCKKYSQNTLLLSKKAGSLHILKGPTSEILTKENLEEVYKVPIHTLYQKERLHRSILKEKQEPKKENS